MNSKVIIGLVVILLTGCSSVTQTNSRSWHQALCSGFKTWDSCMRQADSACPKGFDIRNQQENQVTQERTLEFSCK